MNAVERISEYLDLPGAARSSSGNTTGWPEQSSATSRPAAVEFLVTPWC